jgi:hypothetical protein
MSARIAESVEVENRLGWTLTVYRVTLDTKSGGAYRILDLGPDEFSRRLLWIQLSADS